MLNLNQCVWVPEKSVEISLIEPSDGGAQRFSKMPSCGFCFPLVFSPFKQGYSEDEGKDLDTVCLHVCLHVCVCVCQEGIEVGKIIGTVGHVLALTEWTFFIMFANNNRLKPLLLFSLLIESSSSYLSFFLSLRLKLFLAYSFSFY